MKKWAKAKSLRHLSTATLLSCKKSKFQLLIFGFQLIFDFKFIDSPAFCLGPRASGLTRSKYLHKTKKWNFCKAIQSWFMQNGQIPTFYFANLNLPQFYSILLRPHGPQGGLKWKKSVKANILRSGSTTTLFLFKKSKFQLLIFCPRPTGQDPCSPQGASPYKTA